MIPGWYINGMWWSKYKCIKFILITLIVEVMCPFKHTPPIRLTLNTTFTFSSSSHLLSSAFTSSSFLIREQKFFNRLSLFSVFEYHSIVKITDCLPI